MYSTEMIRRFPTQPAKPILFVVYNKDHVDDAEFYISQIHGVAYLNKYVTVVPLNTKVDDYRSYDVYIDPMVYKYQHSWND